MPFSRSATMAPGAPARASRAVTGTGAMAPPLPSSSSSSLAVGVQRTLFQARLTRRPTPPTNNATSGASVSGSGSGSGSGSSERLRFVGGASGGGGGGGGGVGSAMAGRMPDVNVLSDTSEIVVRDEHGEAEVKEPAQVLSPEHLGDDEAEAKEERQKLTEAVQEHQRNYAGELEQPEELLEAVRASLRERVASLADDCWMFESDRILAR